MAYRYRASQAEQVNFASGLNFLAGLWLIVSPWVYGRPTMPNGAVWNSVVVGIVIAIFAASRFYASFETAGLSWLNAVLGAWMIASPWVYGYAGNVAFTWNSVIVGVIVLILAAISATASESMADESGYRDYGYGPWYGGGYGYGPYGYGWGEPRGGERWYGRYGGYEAMPWTGGPGYGRHEERVGEYRGRGPKNYRRNDEQIKDDICERMADDPQLDASDLEVKVSAGEVRLEGTVPSRWAKRLAEDIADSVSGVRDVTNDLRVAGGGGREAPRRVA